MKTKQCFRCKQAKPISEFGLTKYGTYRSYCAQCKREMNAIDRQKESHKEHHKLYMREYRKTHKQKTVVSTEKRHIHKKTYLSNPDNREKYNVRRKIERMIKNGKILREPCFICGNPNVEAHHPDYKNPLYVVFLCKECHSTIHRLP